MYAPAYTVFGVNKIKYGCEQKRNLHKIQLIFIYSEYFTANLSQQHNTIACCSSIHSPFYQYR